MALQEMVVVAGSVVIAWVLAVLSLVVSEAEAMIPMMVEMVYMFHKQFN
jgi:hypothetical protein